MNHYSGVWFWRASDQAALTRHLGDRPHATREMHESSRPGLLRSALLSLAGLVERPVEARPIIKLPAREGCACKDSEEVGCWEPVLDDGGWVLRCPECGHLDRLEWLSDEARPLVLGLARRRPMRMRKAAKA